MSATDIDVAVEDARWSTAIGEPVALVAQAVEAALAVMPDTADRSVAVSVLLTDDAAVQTLNKIWRGKDKPTNVLSFPAAAQPLPPGVPRPLGDIVLAYDTVLRETEEQSKPLEHHLVHLLVHGTLHLLGLDHETGEADAEVMESLEVAALRALGVPDPYAD